MDLPEEPGPSHQNTPGQRNNKSRPRGRGQGGYNGARPRRGRGHSMHPSNNENLQRLDSKPNASSQRCHSNQRYVPRYKERYSANTNVQYSQTWNQNPYMANQVQNPTYIGKNHRILTYKINSQARSMSQLNLEENNERSHDQPKRQGRGIGYKFLKELSMKDSKQVIISINARKDAFLQLLQSPIDNPDFYVLIMKIITILCKTSFDQLKTNLLLDICHSQFITNLRNYLADLPYTQSPRLNTLYWENPIDFWENFICFCDNIINTFPSVAISKCRSLIEGISKYCLEGLGERHGFKLPQVHLTKLDDLRQKMTLHEQENEKVKQHKNFTMDYNINAQPPENFRQLSILPQREDLLDERPYLRPNIINGGYTDVEHYLDVQFRLLREDCFGPLRDGIYQYLQDPTRKFFDNIRVTPNVKFVHFYANKQRIGYVVQVDQATSVKFSRINWAHSKRLIFGTLLLFTKDNCKSFNVATVLDRDITYLKQGKIPVSLADKEINEDLCKIDESYVMIESQVYFEPYFHVLKALQEPKFPEHIAMKQYIVDVNPQPRRPSYLTENCENTEFTIDSSLKFTVLNENSWPSSEKMGLNESQYEAYRLALTHEFVVIQGPPGTGKTYIGVKVAKTLIENLSTNSECLLLLICYTNHALDQFLEAIIPITNSIARIGGQSRSEILEQFNINILRRTSPEIEIMTNNLYLQHKSNLNLAMHEFKVALEQMNNISKGVLSYTCIQKHNPESYILGEIYKNKNDPLAYWLFETMPCSFDESLLNEDIVEENNPSKTVDDDIYKRDDVILDDFDDEEREVGISEVFSSFSVGKAETKIKLLLYSYRASENFQEKQDLITEITLLSSRVKMFKEMYDLCSKRERHNVSIVDPRRLSPENRWRIYFGWAETISNMAKDNIISLQAAVQRANTAYEETRMMMDLEVLKNIKVIGMTTSGAARLRKLLQALAPPIVIVEEAAEVMEQHIVTALTEKCQHLILIGDHQQLRPSAAHMKLAKYYKLEVSLFERMIVNKIHSRRLDVQHRMRPEIAALISPHIYPDLENHHSVESFPRVLGMCNNLFFLTHDFKEEQVEDSASRANHKEADMVLGLANYLMMQQYKPGDVTILAAYSGQMFYMRKQREKYAHLSKVKITVVDNYQGEESKIILLSLVRNNNQGNIGFLKTENRVCVALSRAREGFYIFGNIDILKQNSDLWSKIAGTLEESGSLGTSLRLRCEVHENQITTISRSKDFHKVPEGGCLLKCNSNLRFCGHKCPLICHGYDKEHLVIKCPLKCERIICLLEHVCPLTCAEKCWPCTEPVLRTLPCGHSIRLPCSRDPADPTIKCLVQVKVTLPHCRHEALKRCHMHINHASCPVSCDARLACGHVCTLSCHVTNDPDHTTYNCTKPCEKAKIGCSVELEGELGLHKCRNKCYEPCEDCEVEVEKRRSNCKHKARVACNKNVDDIPCRLNCARMMPCGHFCKKKCYEKCGDCKQKVTKKIPDCGHEVKMMCSAVPSREHCGNLCERQLSCGHTCRARCAEPCDATKCAVIMPRTFDSPCGHKVSLPCNVRVSDDVFTGGLKSELLLKHCAEPCRELLACGHLCGGTCARCRQGRLHAPCTQTCNQIIICGHQCEEPCNQICPPCKKPCEVKCKHSKCRNLCGKPCTPCKEKCSRACDHGACTRLCGQQCSLGPCTAPCPASLPCGHPCRGLCGEPCPPVCKQCRPDTFPKDFLGDDFEDDDKFIVLEDCNHVLELENMNNLMFGDKETVSIRTCPYCRKPIINTHRYKDFVNNMFKKEINPIKERVYGTSEQINKRKNELNVRTAKMIEEHPKIYDDNDNYRRAFVMLHKKMIRKKKVSLLELEMYSVYVTILEMLSDIYNEYVAAALYELQDQLIIQVGHICSTLMNNIQKISQQQQKDIGNEIKRLTSIIKLAKIMSHASYKSSKQVPKVQNAFENAKALVIGWTVYNENDSIRALETLQEAIKVFGIVSKQERELIVKAIGLKAGHWFKCPNGHFYCIGECGGAMQVSRCIECGASIGGKNHQLLASNQHAREIDGSRFAAWSQEYNNMANFNLDNI